MTFLDTSFLIEYVSGNEKALKKIEEQNCKTSTVSFFELFRGALRSDYSSHNVDVVQNQLEWVEKVDFDSEAAKISAAVEKELEEKGEMINLADILIAATAMKEDSKLLTADSDFKSIQGLEVEMLE